MDEQTKRLIDKIALAFNDLVEAGQHLTDARLVATDRGVGNNGTLVINREGWEGIPEQDNGKSRIEAIPLQAADKQDHAKHVQNFVDSIKSRKAPICDVEIGRNAAVVAHMGNISYRTGDKLYWDHKQGKFTNNPNANRFLQPSYRTPWTFPPVG
jgi:hypothetical protein